MSFTRNDNRNERESEIEREREEDNRREGWHRLCFKRLCRHLPSTTIQRRLLHIHRAVVAWCFFEFDCTVFSNSMKRVLL